MEGGEKKNSEINGLLLAPLLPLFAVSCSTHFEKVRESEGGSVSLLSHFVLNKVSCLVQLMERTAAENSTGKYA